LGWILAFARKAARWFMFPVFGESVYGLRGLFFLPYNFGETGNHKTLALYIDMADRNAFLAQARIQAKVSLRCKLVLALYKYSVLDFAFL
jgi:hypothetical protein